MHPLCGGGEVRVDDDTIGVADDEQRRVAEGFPVLQELLIGGVEVLVAALVLEREGIALPDVGEPVAAGGLGGVLLAIVVSGWR